MPVIYYTLQKHMAMSNDLNTEFSDPKQQYPRDVAYFIWNGKPNNDKERLEMKSKVPIKAEWDSSPSSPDIT